MFGRPSQQSDAFGSLYDENLRLVLFGGKGGVGKTTIAAAFSLFLSEHYPRKHFLIVSTDPAHSLSDSFEQSLGPEPRPVCDRSNLFAVELDAQGVLARLREQDGPALSEIVQRGTCLDQEDVSRFLDLTFPGQEELSALTEVMGLAQCPEYDLVIVDTAPTGHCLRMLDLPDLLRAWGAFLDVLMQKHRYLARVYTGSYKPGRSDAFIGRLSKDSSTIRRLLRDPRGCRFVPVTTLEPVVLSETSRLLSVLAERSVPVRQVVINQVAGSDRPCQRCELTESAQQACLAMLREQWPGLPQVLIPVSPLEVRGEKALSDLAAKARLVESNGEVGPSARRGPPHEARFRCSGLPVPVGISKPGIRFFVFCGKGGVGKTTLACAFALTLSRRFPQKRLLLFSADPAHSVSDCLSSQTPADGHTQPRGNLSIVEIDSLSLFGAFKQTYAQQVEEALRGVSGTAGTELRFEREALAGLLNLAPPGLDEIMSLAQLADYVEHGHYDLYVLDLAPTGHGLRFLESPGEARKWLGAFFEVLLKHRNVLRLRGATDLLVDMSRKVRRIQECIGDREQCECIPVALPGELPLRETLRLTERLKTARLPVRRLLLNRVSWPADGCGFCKALAAERARAIRAFREAFPELELIVVPEVLDVLKGPRVLEGLLALQ